MKPGARVILQCRSAHPLEGPERTDRGRAAAARRGPSRQRCAGAGGRRAGARRLPAAARAGDPEGAELAEQVRIVGHVDDMAAAFLAAHVAVVASIEPEAFGRTATEAQMMGTPVIATDIGAPPETVLSAQPRRRRRGARGGWCRPTMRERLAEALAAALTLTPEARPRMGARAHAHVARSFSLEGMKQQTLEGLRRPARHAPAPVVAHLSPERSGGGARTAHCVKPRLTSLRPLTLPFLPRRLLRLDFSAVRLGAIALLDDELGVARQRERRVVHGRRPVARCDAALLLALGELLLADVEVVVLVGGPIERERAAEVAGLRAEVRRDDGRTARRTRASYRAGGRETRTAGRSA